VDRDIVRAWVDGWVVSRGAAPPIEEPWGFTIDVGHPEHVARHVLPDVTEKVVRTITETTTAQNTWLKVFVPPETVLPWLAPGWTLAAPGFLMSASLQRFSVDVPDGYRLRTWTQGGVLRALIRTNEGAYAARGQMAAPAGESSGPVVFDQIGTDAAHRRKGLGRLVMRTLANAALEAGASAGVLGATIDGQALYESLGWRTHGPLTSIVLGPAPA